MPAPVAGTLMFIGARLCGGTADEGAAACVNVRAALVAPAATSSRRNVGAMKEANRKHPIRSAAAAGGGGDLAARIRIASAQPIL